MITNDRQGLLFSIGNISRRLKGYDLVIRIALDAVRFRLTIYALISFPNAHQRSQRAIVNALNHGFRPHLYILSL
jgi:hypothetical protein